MSPRNGFVRSVDKIVDQGPGRERWDLVLMGDGYRADELPKYEQDVAGVVARILGTAPFDELRAGINVHRIDVVSDESGAGDLCAGRRRATFFRSTFCHANVERLLVADEGLVIDTALDAVPEMNAALVVVNSETYGGSGGSIAVFSTAPDAFEIALHEMGHSLFGLADEYPYWSDCSEADRERYAGPEPAEPNVAADVNALKWRDLVTPGVAIPTTRNANCGDCDPQPNPVAADAVGAFEGAHHYRCGVYRPQYDCRMRTLGAPFCAVCQQTIRRVLAPFAPASSAPGRRRRVRS